MFDVIIAGGGPAGLQAALVLGRARRRVLLCDSGQPRNTVTPGVHGFLSRDGIDPEQLRQIAAAELRHYDTIELRREEISSVQPGAGHFAMELAGGGHEHARKLILATGVVDQLPPIPGLEPLWGKAVFHCPYCDGFELRDQPLAWLDSSATAGLMALALRDWSPDVVLCTNGPSELSDEDRARLSAAGIPARDQPITRLEPHGNRARLTFTDGPPLERRAIFTHPPTRQRSDLPAQLGCRALEDESIEVNDFAQTSVPGVYAAGDMARRPTMPFPAAQAIHAASAGGIAAIAAHRELIWNEIEAQTATTLAK